MNLSKIKSFMQIKPSIIPKIETFLQMENASSYKAKTPAHKPSVLGSPCLRKIYYSYFRTPEEPEFDIKRTLIFKAGYKVEEAGMEWLKGSNLHIPYRNKDGLIPIQKDGKEDPQFPVKSPRWRIPKGKIDNVFVLDGKLYLMDIKSINSNKFKTLDKPDDSYIIQTALYYQMFQDLLKIGEYSNIPELKGFTELSGVMILYICKDSYQMKEYWVNVAQLKQIIPQIDQKIQLINKYIDQRVLPPKTKDWCNFCPYKSKCDKNENV